MLAALTIKNIVLIEHLTITFEEGLCALTGETGAGKSILLDSMGLALGMRAEAGLVRKGADKASVTATFDLPVIHPIWPYLKEQDLEVEEDLIIRRTLTADGRSKAFINDQPVSVSLLKDIGDMLVEIHGQFDTQNLLNAKYHRGMLDEYGVPQKDIEGLGACWKDWQRKKSDLETAKARMEKARADEAYLRTALEDLDALAPQEGEEQKLSNLRDRLMKREQYLESLNVARGALEEAESVMGQGWRALDRIGEEAKDILEAMDRASAEMQEALAQIAGFSNDLAESEYDLTEIDDRLFTLKNQARKFACTIDELPAKREELAEQLNLIEGQDDALESMIKAVEKVRSAYIAQAKIIQKARQQAAQKLDALVAKELPPLKLDKARFETAIEELGEAEWGPHGTERVQFLVATNPGAEAGPLNKIASGGEMSRFMLALKVVMAEIGTANTLVFDEVDSGVGGATADAVGERLARLAYGKQILVVTHSPQVAARASHHWIVAKDGDREVRTNVIALPEMEKRREEIARMLSGAHITEEARAAAAKLLEGQAA